MLTPEQIALRKRGLGASEIPTICGLNPWRRSAIDVWLEKTSRAEPFTGNARTRRGDAMEPAILRWWAERRGAVDLVSPGTLIDSEHEWLFATPDAQATVEGEPMIAEAKYVGERVRHHWPPDEMPDMVRAQCLIQQRVSGIHRAEVAAWIDPGDDPDDERILSCPWDPDIVADLIDIAGEFWRENVLKDIPPAVDASQSWRAYLEKRFPRDTKPLDIAPPEADEWVEKRESARRAIALAEHAEAEAENALKAIIGERAGIVRSGRYRVTWKNDKKGRVSWKQVAEALGAPVDLIEAHTGEPPRRFLVHLEK